jgi:Zonular occludens toxin (Zot).
MKIIYTGIESSGKSLLLSKQAEKVRCRNIKWFKITGLKRTMAFNSPMAPEFINLIETSNINYIQFKNLDDIIYLEEADIFIDEVIKFFPASGSNSLSNEQLHFITQGAKSGIHLWGASQDFSQVHKQFRLLVNEVYVITKLIGSARPMKTAPPVKRIWGICSKRRVNPLSFKGDSATMEQLEGGLSIFFIRLKDVQRFDTSYKIPISKLPIKKLRRQEEHCEEDNFKRIKYI